MRSFRTSNPFSSRRFWRRAGSTLESGQVRGQAGGEKAGLRVVIVPCARNRVQEMIYTDQRVGRIPPFKMEPGMV